MVSTTCLDVKHTPVRWMQKILDLCIFKETSEMDLIDVFDINE